MSWNLNDYIAADGSIRMPMHKHYAWWDSYRGGHVRLDGLFTPDELHAIANHIEHHTRKEAEIYHE